MKNYIMANFKMNKTDDEVQKYFKELLSIKSDTSSQIVVAVPSVSIKTAYKCVKDTDIMIAGQNFNHNEFGAYTGEINADMLKNAGAKAVLVGHSERRNIFNETNEYVNKKLFKGLKSGLVCVMCVGETLFDRKNNMTKAVLQQQLVEGLKNIYANELKNIVIAYEPVWAIGTGEIAKSTDIKDAIRYIRDILSQLYDENIASGVAITYGGSVNETNAKEIAKIDGVNGVLVGGASLDPQKFNAIIDAFAQK